ncbi:MAG TPA: hypothetical protein VGM08_00035 [Candidatus Saccharimonadales bacterium]|jgi:hypothetical protein
MSVPNETLRSPGGSSLFESVTVLEPENTPPALLFAESCWEDRRQQRELDRIAAELIRRNYVFTTDEALGFGPELRKHLVTDYFDTDLVRRHEGDKPADRERARDVLYYERTGLGDPRGYGLALGEHSTAVIFDRKSWLSPVTGERQISRVEVMQDRQLAEFAAAALSVLPLGQQYKTGTFSINFFRTHSNVVSGPHHDNQTLVMIYVVDKRGADVVNRLIPELGMTAIREHCPGISVYYDKVLQPGDILMFFDDAYAHDVIGSLGQEAHRDVLVCTADHPTAYGIYGRPGSPEWMWRESDVPADLIYAGRSRRP